MRVLVTGGAGFIGSHFAKRLPAAGDDVVVLDKLTYSGNRANLEGADVEFFEGDICDPEAVAEAAAGVRRDRQLRRRDARRPLDPRRRGVHRDRRARHLRPARLRPRRRRPARPGLDRRGLRRRARGRTARPRADPLAPVEPVLRPRRPAATCRCSPPCAPSAIDACITRGANTYGPNQYPEKLIPLFVTNALDGEPLPVYGDGRQRREWLHVEDHCAAVELVLREGRAGEVYNVGGEEHENLEITNRILELDRRRRRPGPPRRRPARPRPPLLARRLEAPRPRLVARSTRFDGRASPRRSRGTASNRAWWEPIKSGEYREYYEQQYAERLGSS